MKEQFWSVYIIISDDDRLYTGITNNLAKRWYAHLNTKSGAKFFRGRKPERLLYVESGFNRSTASKREAAIKKLMRAEKLLLLESQREIDWHSRLELSVTSKTP